MEGRCLNTAAGGRAARGGNLPGFRVMPASPPAGHQTKPMGDMWSWGHLLISLTPLGCINPPICLERGTARALCASATRRTPQTLNVSINDVHPS